MSKRVNKRNRKEQIERSKGNVSQEEIYKSIMDRMMCDDCCFRFICEEYQPGKKCT